MDNEMRSIYSFDNLSQLLSYYDEIGIAQDDPIRHIGFERFLQHKSRESGIPQNGIFELTPLCNFDCRMCYVHLSRNQLGEKQLLKADTWIKFFDDAIDHGMIGAQLTGGEAMMYPQFEELYLHLFRKGIKIAIMTNGLLLTDDRLRFFKEYPPIGIQISLYGHDDDSYENVTGKRVYRQVVENIRKAKEELPNVTFTVSVTPSRYIKAKEVAKLLQLGKELGIKTLVNMELTKPYEGTGRSIDDFSLSIDELVEARLEQTKFKGIEIVPFLGELPEIAGDEQPKEKAKGIKCSAGRSTFAINWKGDMKPCLDLDFSVNVLEKGFEDSWRIINNAAKEWRVPDECTRCAYGNLCVRCPARHALGASDGHADRSVCEMTQKMIRAGVFSKKKEE